MKLFQFLWNFFCFIFEEQRDIEREIKKEEREFKEKWKRYYKLL